MTEPCLPSPAHQPPRARLIYRLNLLVHKGSSLCFSFIILVDYTLVNPSFSHNSYVQLLDRHKLIVSSSCVLIYTSTSSLFMTLLNPSFLVKVMFSYSIITKGSFLFLVLICFTILVYHSFESYQPLTIVMFSSAKDVRWLVEAP